MPAGYFVDGKLTYKPLVSVVSEFGSSGVFGPATKTLAVVGEFPFLQAGVAHVFSSKEAFLAAAPGNRSMLELASMIFSASTVAPFNGSPGAVILINAQQSYQAYAVLDDIDGVEALKFLPFVWGSQGNGGVVRFTLSNDSTYSVFVSNGGGSEEFTFDRGLNALTLTYQFPDADATDPATAYGFGDKNGGSGILRLVKVHDEDKLKCTFTRTLTQLHDRTGAEDLAGEKSWVPGANQIVGNLTVTKPAGAQTLPSGSLSVWIYGTSDTGETVAQEIGFTNAEITGPGAVTKSLSDVPEPFLLTSLSHVTITTSGDNAAPADIWVGQIQISGEGFICGPENGQTTVADAIAFYNGLKGFSANTDSFRPASLPLIELDPADFAVGTTVADGVDATRFQCLEAFELYCTLISTEVLSRKSLDLPDVVGSASAVTLAGGSEVAAINLTKWEEAFASLRTKPVSVLVPYSTNNDVHLAAYSHTKFMWSKGQREMQLVISPENDLSLSTLNSRRRAYADHRVTVLPHKVQITQWDGKASPFHTKYLGLIFGALQCSNSEIGVPLGGARPNVRAFSGHASIIGYDAADTLIANGFTPLEDNGDGIRIVRWVTTHGATNDLSRTEGSAVECLAHSNIGVRNALRPLLNRKATPDFAGTIRNAVSSELARQTGGILRAWYPDTLQVQETNNAYVVRYSVSLILPVNSIVVTSVVIDVPAA